MADNFSAMKTKYKKLKDPDFFVVGLQKSGTFWVTALLDAHPEIRCFPSLYGGQTGVSEGRIFDMLASINDDGGKAFRNSFLNHHGEFFTDLVPLLGKVSRKELYDKFRDRYREWFAKHNPEEKRLVGDKTTEYIFHLPMIDDFYPAAKKICIIREPKDRIVSWHFHQIRKGRKKTRTISDRFVREYMENRISKEYRSMLDYGGFIHCLTYEGLFQSPQERIRDMLLYLGARVSDDIIAHMIAEGSIERVREKDTLYTRGKNKKREGPLLKSHYRKGIVGDWKNYITKQQAEMIDSMTSDLEEKVFKKYNVSP